MKIILPLVLSLVFTTGSVVTVNAGQGPEEYEFQSCSVHLETPSGKETTITSVEPMVVVVRFHWNRGEWDMISIDNGHPIKARLIQHGPCL